MDPIAVSSSDGLRESANTMRRWVFVALPIVPVLFFFLNGRACQAGGGPKNVLLVINDNSPVSQAVGAYYKQKRDIPDANICRIRCSTAEEVGRTECENNIVAPIRNFLAGYDLSSRIDYIVLTKGIPLKASYSNTYFTGPVSVSSLLTCVGEPSITYPMPDPSEPVWRVPLVNPYGPTASPAAPEQHFTHQLSFDGHSFYAVTRLDAYTEADIYRMIDDSVAAQPVQGLFLLDGCDAGAYGYINDRLAQANDALVAAGLQTYYDSATFRSNLREFVGWQQGVMGYFSWGSNETYSDPAISYSFDKYTSNQFLPGSIADTFVSYSGRTFTYPPSSGQSLLADLIPQGLCGGNAFVSEPNVNLATYPNVLFDRYLKGYNLAESFMAATPELYWKSVIIGDPLMAPYATPPVVTFFNPLADAELHGTVEVSVDAVDSSGIRKVEFFIDHEPVAVCASPPYRFEWDTTGCEDGTYTIEVIAYEDSPVYTQGRTKIEARVVNTPEPIMRIGDLSHIADGKLVSLNARVITAGADAFADCIYIGDSDRTAGVRVIGATSLQTGDLADVTGEKRTVAGQTTVQAVSIRYAGKGPVPAPIGLTNRDVGNRGIYTGPGASSLRVGLQSTGLLIKTWGQVQQITTDAFYIADRSIRLPDGTTGRLKVLVTGMKQVPTMPALGSFVGVTGISALEPAGADLRPVLRPRKPSDISYNLAFEQLSAPPGTIAEQWNLLSVPGIPSNPSAASVLPGIDLEGRLHAWDPVTQGMVTYSAYQPEMFPPLCMGVGFWLQVFKSYDLVTRVVLHQPDTDVWISLPCTGSTLIGHPFRQPRRLAECRVTDGVRILSLDEAVRDGWLDSAIHYWRSSEGGLFLLDLEYGLDSSFEPWHGFWVRTFRPNLALIIPYAQN